MIAPYMPVPRGHADALDAERDVGAGTFFRRRSGLGGRTLFFQDDGTFHDRHGEQVMKPAHQETGNQADDD